MKTNELITYYIGGSGSLSGLSGDSRVSLPKSFGIMNVWNELVTIKIVLSLKPRMSFLIEKTKRNYLKFFTFKNLK